MYVYIIYVCIICMWWIYVHIIYVYNDGKRSEAQRNEVDRCVTAPPLSLYVFVRLCGFSHFKYYVLRFSLLRFYVFACLRWLRFMSCVLRFMIYALCVHASHVYDFFFTCHVLRMYVLRVYVLCFTFYVLRFYGFTVRFLVRTTVRIAVRFTVRFTVGSLAARYRIRCAGYLR